MAMESTMQIRMNSDLKAQVEALYRSLRTSFAKAVDFLLNKVSAKVACLSVLS